MQDYAEYLLAEARSDIAALHQFKILYDPEGSGLHFFFEGEEDSLFYMPEARRYASGRIPHVYDCGGKGNVIEVRDSVKKDGYNTAGCLFFVDRDYDDYLGTQVQIDDETYITDEYSIENYVSTIDCAKVILEDVIRISKADPEFAMVIARISNGYEKFLREVRPLIAWIIAAKESGCRPNLQNTDGLKGVVTTAASGPSLTHAGFLQFKRKVVSNGRVPPISSVIRWRRILDLASARLWLRGKYDIWFFHSTLLLALNEASERRRAAGGRAVRIPNSIREGRIFEVIGGRIPPPQSLQEFYRRRLAL